MNSELNSAWENNAGRPIKKIYCTK